MIVHREVFRKQNSELNKLFSIENVSHKNLSQRTYQWGTQGIKQKTKTEIKENFHNKSFSQNLSQRSYQWGYTGETLN